MDVERAAITDERLQQHRRFVGTSVKWLVGLTRWCQLSMAASIHSAEEASSVIHSRIPHDPKLAAATAAEAANALRYKRRIRDGVRGERLLETSLPHAHASALQLHRCQSRDH